MRLFLLSSLVLLLACGDDEDGALDAGEDTRVPDASTTQCTSNSTCDDGIYCNGFETCDSDAPTANAIGCVAGEPPCDAEVCVEEEDLCDDCIDADGDGHDAMSCGGDDCDDDNPNRYPTNMEFCDADGVDEDCDPETVGFRDNDGDGVVDAMCCNGDTCAGDCDDDQSLVGPDGTEVCDDVDNDCDGRTDEGLGDTYYPDVDGDGFGDPDAGMPACMRPEGFVDNRTDCDDTDRSINPSAFDICDGVVDQDCDGTLDNPPGGCECTTGMTRPCPGAMGVCAEGTQACVDGDWEECSIVATPEVCNLLDDDCDGAVDNGVPTRTWYRDSDGDGVGDSDVPERLCGSGAPEGYVSRRGDCDDDDENVYPGQREYFRTEASGGGFDYNCDGEETPLIPTAVCAPGLTRLCELRVEGFYVVEREVPCGSRGVLAQGCELNRLTRLCEVTEPTRGEVANQTCQ